MALPKIEKPIFELILPSTGETIRYTPFSVKEEKILLIAQESKELEQAILAVTQIVNNCLINKSVEDLAMFDLEYVLLTLRSKSVDNNVKFSVKDPETDEAVELELDLSEIKVTANDKHSKELRINESYILYMRYPTINEFMHMLKKGAKDTETNFKIMVDCMDRLVSQDEVYNFSDFNEEEINDFLDNLESDVIKKLKVFFDTMPKLRHEIKYTNSKGNDKTFVIEGMVKFFYLVLSHINLSYYYQLIFSLASAPQIPNI